jgi:hypothetical protein
LSSWKKKHFEKTAFLGKKHFEKTAIFYKKHFEKTAIMFIFALKFK